MRKRKRASEKPDKMPVSTMIDVVFLILIYFIVTQKPILEETMIKTKLPGPPDEIIDPPIDPNPMRIDVFKESGDFYRLNGRAYKKEFIFNYLKDVAESNPEQQILINCGSNAKHEKLVKLLDVCAEVKLENLNIVNDKSRPLEK